MIHDKMEAKAKEKALEKAKQANASSKVWEPNPNADSVVVIELFLDATIASEPVPAASDMREIIAGLSSGVRPHDSSLSQQKMKAMLSEKHAASKVDKGKCPAKDSASKRQKCNALTFARVASEPIPPSTGPSLSIVSEVTYNDASASAILFSKAAYPANAFHR